MRRRLPFVLVFPLPAALIIIRILAAPAEAEEGKTENLSFLEGKDRAAFLARVEERMNGMRSINADFEQEKSLEIFKDTVRASGAIYFARPDSLRWEIREPFHSILIVSGKDVGKFEYEGTGKGAARRSLKLGRGGEAILIVMDRIRSWFLGKFDHEGKYYEVDVREKPAPLIVLRPRIAQLQKSIKTIELELSESLTAVEKVTLLEPNGDKTVLRFKEKRRDGQFPDRTFSVLDPAEMDARRDASSAPEKKTGKE